MLRRLTKEVGLEPRLPGSYTYKVARARRLDIPNLLSSSPIRCAMAISRRCGPVSAGIIWLWCLTLIPGVPWAGRCLVDLILPAVKALEMVYQQWRCPSGMLFQSDQSCQYSDCFGSGCGINGWPRA